MPSRACPPLLAWNVHFSTHLARAGLITLAYFLTTWLGVAFHTESERLAVFCPASGLLLGVLVLSDRRTWPIILVAILTVHLIGNGLADKPLGVNLGHALVNLLSAWLGAWLLGRFFPAPVTLAQVREVFGLVLLPGFLVAGFTALGGAAVSAAGLGTPFWSTWQVRWLSE